ncbi:PspC domain-containing protein [Porphyromonadaceae bacterium OttesenSCG-928-L07]|nr:PspC domain-containing protein [Porphyromonadaceae bacterium OttesenSCG-928-L07]MDL2251943.1 PspC domain-containing protein [Odoribacter sp. OttesenSCG-928-J03]
MKKVLNVGIGGRSFVIDKDAYQRLSLYLDRFRRKANMGHQTREVMDELEVRIAELLSESLTSRQEVVNISLVNSIIDQLGMPDGSTDSDENFKSANVNPDRVVRKFYRDPDDKWFGGVCGGLSAFLGIDVVVIRILFVIALFMGSLGFWLYIICWLVAPLAYTPAQKCEMRGLPATVENMSKFSRHF